MLWERLTEGGDEDSASTTISSIHEDNDTKKDDTDEDILVIETGEDEAAKKALATEIANLTEADRDRLNTEYKNEKKSLSEVKAELKTVTKKTYPDAKARKAKTEELKDKIKEHKDRIIYLNIARESIGSNDAMTETLKQADPDLTPAKWFDNLVPTATFLGESITGNRSYKSLGLGGVHLELYERLKKAEDILMVETGLDAPAVGKKLGLRAISGFREPDPATGKKTGMGSHSLGLAVDINGDLSNPYLQRESSRIIIERLTTLITGTGINVRDEPPEGKGKTKTEKRVSQAEQVFDRLGSISETMKIYFQFADATEVTMDGKTLRLEVLAKRFEEKTGVSRTVTEWQELIASDRKILMEKDTGDWGKRRDPAEGMMDLDKRLVIALVKAGLTWGGTLGEKKDIMHFDYRGGTIPRENPNIHWAK